MNSLTRHHGGRDERAMGRSWYRLAALSPDESDAFLLGIGRSRYILSVNEGRA